MVYKASSEIEKIVAEHNRKVDETLNSHNADGYIELITDDYTYYEGADDANSRRSHEEVRANCNVWFPLGYTQVTKPQEVLNISNDSIINIGELTIGFLEGNVKKEFPGKVIQLMVRESDGKWRTKFDFFVS